MHFFNNIKIFFICIIEAIFLLNCNFFGSDTYNENKEEKIKYDVSIINPNRLFITLESLKLYLFPIFYEKATEQKKDTSLTPQTPRNLSETIEFSKTTKQNILISPSEKYQTSTEESHFSFYKSKYKIKVEQLGRIDKCLYCDFVELDANHINYMTITYDQKNNCLRLIHALRKK